MAQQVPTLRAPMPGFNKPNGGNRAPRLTLGIPPSPNARPVNQEAEPLPEIPRYNLPSRAPKLSLATPMGGQGHIGDAASGVPSRPPKLSLATPMMGHSHVQDNTAGLRPIHPPLSISTGVNDHRGADNNYAQSIPGSASSSTASINAYGGYRGRINTPDPSSAISSAESEFLDRDSGVDKLAVDFDELMLERGRPLDVEDLDDDMWMAASEQKKIIELGSLGEGAGGAVTRCILQGGKTVFALKIITTSPDPDIKRQILRELKINKDCMSDYICQYYGAFSDKSSSTISIAMEFCEGGSLDSVYREVKKRGGRTGEKVLGKVAEGVLHGLTYLNGRKIMHRDIKPSNILLCRNGQVKLCDFGVSGEFGTKGDANTFIGTSYYMAPERIQGQSYTITSDVWSLGVTLLEVAQHRFPFPADGTEAQPKALLIDLLTYIVVQPIPKLKDEPGIKWGENFKYFIECCLEKEPKRRASPWRMLEHPWMLELKTKKISMANFLKQVWDWKD